MKLRVACVDLHRNDDGSEPPDLVELLFADMAELEHLGEQLNRQGGGETQAETLRRFRSLLSLEVSARIWELRPGWHKEFREAIQHDRTVLNGQPDATPSGASARERQLAGRSFHLALDRGTIEGSGSAISAERRLLEQAFPSADAARVGYAEVCIEELVRQRLVPGWRLLEVTVGAGSSSATDVLAEADAERWTVRGSGRRGLLITVSVHDPPWQSSVARLWFEDGTESSGWAGKLGRARRRRGEALWRTLTEQSTAAAPPAVHQIAVLLDQLVQVRRKDLEQVLEEVRSYNEGPTTLLRALAEDAGALGSAPVQHKGLVRELLPAIVLGSEWPLVARHVFAVAAACDAPGHLDVYTAVHRRCPVPPRSGDLDVLLQAARELAMTKLPGRAVVAASLQVLRDSALTPAAAVSLRSLMDPSLGDPIAEFDAVRAAVLDVTCDRRRQDRFGQALRDLVPLLQALADGDIGANALLADIATLLADDAPVCDPGVWQTAEQQGPYLDALAAFEGLIDVARSVQWTQADLDHLRVPLPKISGQRPSHYPPEFWSAVAWWLDRGESPGPNFLREYKAAVARWTLARFWQAAAERQSELVAGLEVCARWLQADTPDSAVPHAIGHEFLLYLENHGYAPEARESGLIAVRVLCDPTARDQARFELIKTAFGIEAWKGDFAHEWRGWIGTSLVDGDATMRARLAELTLRGVLISRGAHVNTWALQLLTFEAEAIPAATWDTCLDQLDALLLAGPPPDDLDERLVGVARWLKGRDAAAAKSYGTWSAWLGANARLFADQPNEAWLLRTALLRRVDKHKLKERVDATWPRIPLHFLVRRDAKGLAAFVRCCRQTRAVELDRARIILARALLRDLRRTDVQLSGLESITLFAEVFFRREPDLIRCWKALVGIPGVGDLRRFAEKLFGNEPAHARLDFRDEAVNRARELLTSQPDLAGRLATVASEVRTVDGPSSTPAEETAPPSLDPVSTKAAPGEPFEARAMPRWAGWLALGVALSGALLLTRLLWSTDRPTGQANPNPSLSAAAPPSEHPKVVVNAPPSESPKVLMKTSHGDITIELLPDKAPISVKNFLMYVKRRYYEGTIFHRVVPGVLIQGGGFGPGMQQKPTDAPIENEARNGLKNDRGMVAMARTDAVADSATAQFFINLQNNNYLDQRDDTPNGFGYAVFGKVIRGMNVVERIAGVATTSRPPHEYLPLTPVVIESIGEIAAVLGSTELTVEQLLKMPNRTRYVRGPKNAPVTLTEFADFQCPYSQGAVALVDELLAAYPEQVNFVMRQFPIRQLHANAAAAARAVLAAGKQGKFWQMHDGLFALEGSLSPKSVESLARRIGLDVDKWLADADSDEIIGQLEADEALAREIGVPGTPQFFINGELVVDRSLQAMRTTIDEELRKKGKESGNASSTERPGLVVAPDRRSC